LLALVLAFACSPAAIGLTVDVRTDYHPGLDFTQVVTSLTRAEEGFGGEVREETFVVDGTEDFLAAVRVAEFGDVVAGAVAVQVRLVDSGGRTIADRRLELDLTSSYAALVLLTSNCAGVECPAPAGNAELSECLDAECVDPECSEQAPELCPGACVVDAQCVPEPGCIARVCLDGTCFCADAPPSPPDGGTDSGGMDSGPACECMPGETEDQMMPCGNCDTGTQTDTRTCATDCTWGDFVVGACMGASGCAPGSSAACDNGEPCGEKTCGADCRWGGCELTPGNECFRIGPGHTDPGTNFRCCGTYMWQYCLDSGGRCVWSGACADCLMTSCPMCT